MNAVGNMLEISRYDEGDLERENLLVALSGSGMPVKRAIKKAMEWYPEVVEKVE